MFLSTIFSPIFVSLSIRKLLSTDSKGSGKFSEKSLIPLKSRQKMTLKRLRKKKRPSKRESRKEKRNLKRLLRRIKRKKMKLRRQLSKR